MFLHCNPAYSTVDWQRCKPYKDIKTQKKKVEVPIFMKIKASQVFPECGLAVLTQTYKTL